MSNARITLALPLSAVLMFGTTVGAQAPETQLPSKSQSPSPAQSSQTADMQSFRGCVERDPSTRGMIGASQQTGSEQTALLKKVSPAAQSTRAGEDAQRTAQSSAEAAGQQSGSRAEAADRRDRWDAEAGTYRLVAAAQSSFELVKFIGQQVEVRGTVNPQPVPSGQVDQASRPSQGQQGQPTTVDSPSTDFSDDYKALTVTSITKIADSCESND